MNSLKAITIAAMMTGLCSQSAWSGTLTDISIDEGARTVGISVALCQSNINTTAINTTVDAGVLKAALTAYEDANVQCDSNFMVTLNIPPCVEFNEVGVFLYTPAGHTAMSAADGMGVDPLGACVEDVQPVALAAAQPAPGCEMYDMCNEECSLFPSNYETCMKEWCMPGVDLDSCIAPVMAAATVPAGPVEIDTEPVITQDVQGSVNCTPETLNLKSQGNYITCSAQLQPMPSDVEGVAVGMTVLDSNGGEVNYDLEAASIRVSEDTLLVKVNRAELIGNLGGAVPPAIKININGVGDTIKVINPGKGKK